MHSSPGLRSRAILVLTLLASGVLSLAWIAFLVWLAWFLLKRLF
jgi:hypothetical protein